MIETTAASPSIPSHPERGVETARIEGFDFWDLLDLINPLQHIPLVSTVYRAITGDTIKPPMQIIGGMLFGGPIGFATAIASSLVEEATGREPLSQLAALVTGEDAPNPAPAIASGPPVSLLRATPADDRDRPAGRPVPLLPPAWMSVALAEAADLEKRDR